MSVFRIAAALALTLLSAASTRAGERQSLAGRVSGVLPSGEYVVKSVISVPQGEALSLSAGTVLYFEPFTGIEVSGELSAEGTPDAPVVLTSVSDTGGAAQGFDWNGVDVGGASAVIRMRHARVCNSVYGVKVREFSADAEFERVVFRNNGYASLVRGGQEVPLAVGEPFSAVWNAVQKPRAAESPDDAKNTKKPHKNRKRLAFGLGSAGVSAAGLTMCAVSLSQMHSNFQRYDREDNSDRATTYKEKIRRNTTLNVVGLAAAGTGLMCVGITVFW